MLLVVAARRRSPGAIGSGHFWVCSIELAQELEYQDDQRELILLDGGELVQGFEIAELGVQPLSFQGAGGKSRNIRAMPSSILSSCASGLRPRYFCTWPRQINSCDSAF